MKKKIIFAIEDDPDILILLNSTITKEGFNFEGFDSAESFLNKLKITIPDCIILDLMLPDMEGFEIIKRLKLSNNYKDIPIIIVSAKSDEVDKIVGLEIGADDYLTKPFSIKELIVRIKKQLQRVKINNAEIDEKNDKYVYIKDNIKLILSKSQHSLLLNDERINLTVAEFKILEKLLERPGWIISRDQLLDYLWGHEKSVIDRTIDVHITHLRQKLKQAGKFIINERGIGYKIEGNNDE